MADTTEVHIGGHSREQVAYQLFERIAHAEGKRIHGAATSNVDRDWILKTYAECLVTVNNPGVKWRA